MVRRPLSPSDLGQGTSAGPRGPVARGRRERAGARARPSRDNERYCAQFTICATHNGRAPQVFRVDGIDQRRRMVRSVGRMVHAPTPSCEHALRRHRDVEWSRDSDVIVSFTSTIPNTSPLATQVRRNPHWTRRAFRPKAVNFCVGSPWGPFYPARPV